jgi:hypothetical protein
MDSSKIFWQLLQILPIDFNKKPFKSNASQISSRHSVLNEQSFNKQEKNHNYQFNDWTVETL